MQMFMQNELITIFDRLSSQSQFSEKFSNSIENTSSVDFDYSRDDWEADEVNSIISNDANDNYNCEDFTLEKNFEIGQ